MSADTKVLSQRYPSPVSQADCFPAFQKKGHDSSPSQLMKGLCVMFTEVKIYLAVVGAN